MPHDSFKFDRLSPAVQTCITSETACTGYVFHPAHTATKRIGNTTLDLLGFQRVSRSEHWSAEIILLVQNGRRHPQGLFRQPPHRDHGQQDRAFWGPSRIWAAPWRMALGRRFPTSLASAVATGLK